MIPALIAPLRQHRIALFTGTTHMTLLFGDKLSTEKFQLGINADLVWSGYTGAGSYDPRFSWAFGAYGEIKLSERWHLQPEITLKTPAGANDLAVTTAGSPFQEPTGDATLEMALAAADKRLLASEGERFLRAPPMPMSEREALPGMTVEVAERDEAGIKRLRFTFDVPLEDPSLVLLHWKDGVLDRLAPPAVGSTWTERQPPML